MSSTMVLTIMRRTRPHTKPPFTSVFIVVCFRIRLSNIYAVRNNYVCSFFTSCEEYFEKGALIIYNAMVLRSFASHFFCDAIHQHVCQKDRQQIPNRTPKSFECPPKSPPKCPPHVFCLYIWQSSKSEKVRPKVRHWMSWNGDRFELLRLVCQKKSGKMSGISPDYF